MPACIVPDTMCIVCAVFAAVLLLLLLLAFPAPSTKQARMRDVFNLEFRLLPYYQRTKKLKCGGIGGVRSQLRGASKLWAGLSKLRAPHLLVTVSTPELAEFTQNWICSARQSLANFSILVIADRPSTCAQLQPWLRGNTASENEASSAICLVSGLLRGTATRKSGQSVLYAGKGSSYSETNRARATLYTSLSESHAIRRFRWAIFSDVDLVFRSDPFSYLDSMTFGVASARASTVFFGRNECPVPGVDNDQLNPRALNGGVVSFAPSETSRSLFRAALCSLVEGRTYDGTDQGALQAAAERAWSSSNPNTSGAPLPLEGRPPVTLLPCDKVAPGHLLARPDFAPSSLVSFHMNWAMRSSTKLRCLEATGQWVRRNPPTLCAPFGSSGRGFTVERSGHRIHGCALKGGAWS